eukprot:CAMPEP_0172906758 /NCGR_PEP_ID=MMETSP1075-20121228/177515_1 /TAXON_ID=2916 /ORGANISM="Ceratium fusus, Strain PA161109" /LENGTH=56 /DNA_ID=CAMNT_0013764241 /DNA_START=92 /DNA_END=259 /DNA_ORIENTATION=-
MATATASVAAASMAAIIFAHGTACTAPATVGAAVQQRSPLQFCEPNPTETWWFSRP